LRNTIRERDALAELRGINILFERILSGIVLIILTVSSLWIGSWYLFGVCIFISLIGMMELYRILGIHKQLIGIIGYLFAIVYYICVYFNYQQYSLLILLAALMLIMTVYVISFPKYKIEDAVMVFFGICYVAVMLSYIYQTREIENGIYVVWIIFICSWGNDTFAYFTGVLLGKHKMAPKLSPKKTVEGAIGGVIGAAVLGAVYGYIVTGKLTIVTNTIFVFAVASATGALLSIVGDLAASAIKRDHEVKDYGKLIPGHGGILDRYDSVIFTAPVVFWVVYFLRC